MCFPPSGTVASSISKLAGLNYNMNYPPDHQGDADDLITVVIIGSGFKQLNKIVANKSRPSNLGPKLRTENCFRIQQILFYSLNFCFLEKAA